MRSFYNRPDGFWNLVQPYLSRLPKSLASATKHKFAHLWMGPDHQEWSGEILENRYHVCSFISCFWQRIREFTFGCTDHNMMPRTLLAILFLGYVFFLVPMCYAIDHPDAQDYIGDFQARSHVYEKIIREQVGTAQETLIAYNEYEQFLDRELNQVYRSLQGNLNKKQGRALKISQRNWLKYRDAEFAFITNNWTKKSFGSSFVLSRGDYRATLLRNRVLQLLHYLKNYGS